MRLSPTLFYAAKGNGSQVSRTRQTGLKQGLELAHVCYKTITDFLYFIKNRLRTHGLFCSLSNVEEHLVCGEIACAL